MSEENQPLKTTVVGSIMKPEYLKDVKNDEGKMIGISGFNHITEANIISNFNDCVNKATKEVLDTQSSIGIDIVTDGEMRRDNYVHDFCRNLTGIDFHNPKQKLCRNGVCNYFLPNVISAVSFKAAHERSDPKDEWKFTQNMTNTPVKYTIPGPMTICDSVFNSFYENDEVLGEALVKVINQSILGLVEQGCKYIQVDEPVLVRYPDRAIESGVRRLNQCFDGVPDDVKKIVHICCGYPSYLDQTDYEKADQGAYLQIAEALDSSIIDQISIEDAHRRNPKELFQKFKNKTIILGVIDVVKSRVETVDEIQNHIKEVLQYIPRERLVIAPDCGLIYLPHEIMMQKMTNMVAAAKSL